MTQAPNAASEATAPKLGSDPDTIGYYGIVEDGGRPRLCWVERRRRTGGGTVPAGQWLLKTVYSRRTRQEEIDRDLARWNDTGHYPARIVPPVATDLLTEVRS